MDYSGCSQSGPASAFSSVSVLSLELKVKLVMEMTRRICVHGKKGLNKRMCFSGESGEYQVKRQGEKGIKLLFI